MKCGSSFAQKTFLTANCMTKDSTVSVASVAQWQVSTRERDFLRYPKFKEAYLKSFDRMLQKRMERHLENPKRPLWKVHGQETEYATAIDVFNWWMEYRVLVGQMNWFEDFEEDDDE